MVRFSLNFLLVLSIISSNGVFLRAETDLPSTADDKLIIELEENTHIDEQNSIPEMALSDPISALDLVRMPLENLPEGILNKVYIHFMADYIAAVYNTPDCPQPIRDKIDHFDATQFNYVEIIEFFKCTKYEDYIIEQLHIPRARPFRLPAQAQPVEIQDDEIFDLPKISKNLGQHHCCIQ